MSDCIQSMKDWSHLYLWYTWFQVSLIFKKYWRINFVIVPALTQSASQFSFCTVRIHNTQRSPVFEQKRNHYVTTIKKETSNVCMFYVMELVMELVLAKLWRSMPSQSILQTTYNLLTKFWRVVFKEPRTKNEAQYRLKSVSKC